MHDITFKNHILLQNVEAYCVSLLKGPIMVMLMHEQQDEQDKQVQILEECPAPI